MRKNYYLFFFLLFVCTDLLFSQQESFEFPDQGSDQAIRLSLVHFLDPVAASAHASFEHRLRYNTYLRHELGFFFDYGTERNATLENLEGFRLRTARRAYRWQDQSIKQRYYWEIAADYRYLVAQSRGDFTIFSDNGSFSKQIPYSITQHSLSINYNRGATYNLGKNWQFDVGIGAGVRANYRESTPIAVSASDRALFRTNGGLFWQHTNGRESLYLTPSASIIAALGYQF